MWNHCKAEELVEWSVSAMKVSVLRKEVFTFLGAKEESHGD